MVSFKTSFYNGVSQKVVIKLINHFNYTKVHSFCRVVTLNWISIQDLKDPKTTLLNKTRGSDVICCLPPVFHDLLASRYQRLCSQSTGDAKQIYLSHQAYFAKGDPGGINSVVLKVVNTFQHTVHLAYTVQLVVQVKQVNKTFLDWF